MQNVLTDLIRDIEIPSECFGWINCGKKKMYKGTEIWEIPKNTILYKGIKKDRPQNLKYYADPYYVPGQVSKLGVIERAFPNDDDDEYKGYTVLTSKDDKQLDFIYLADSLSTAAYYATEDDGRIISFITTSKLRLLNFSNKDTLEYIYDKAGDSLKTALSTAFLIHTTPEFISYGRSSTRAGDYALLNLIKESFLWVDGYGYEPVINVHRNFHEEIAILRPSLVLKRYPLEFRPTGIQIVNEQYRKSGLGQVYNPAEIWLKVFDGTYIEPVLIPYYGTSIRTRDTYIRNPLDYRDNFILDSQLNERALLKFLRSTEFYKLSKEEEYFKLINKYIYKD